MVEPIRLALGMVRMLMASMEVTSTGQPSRLRRWSICSRSCSQPRETETASSSVSSRLGNTGGVSPRKPSSSRAIRAAARSSWHTARIGRPASSRRAAIMWARWMELSPVTAEAPASLSPSSSARYSDSPRRAELSRFMETPRWSGDLWGSLAHGLDRWGFPAFRQDRRRQAAFF